MRISFIFIIILISCIDAFAWNDKVTHPTITQYTANKFFDSGFLDKRFGLGNMTSDARGWILRGSILEDSGTKWQFVTGTARSLNHFHVPTTNNPTKSTLETAGLSDRANGKSAINWAQDGAYQKTKGWEDWSWQNVRTYYYNHLTAQTQTDADANMARTLMGLGYQMHLVQDMGHPSHVRNNTHVFDGAGWYGFETWAAKNDTKIIRAAILDKKDFNSNYQFPVPQITVDLAVKFDETHNLIPVARLFDTRTYQGTNTPSSLLNQGLSEYTNGNFFSQDTIFAAERFSGDSSYKYYFPYPRKSGTDTQQFIDGNKAEYISKTGEGETITHLARSGVMSRFLLNTLGEGKRFYGSFKLDEECYQDYAQKLIPRSVAYSKAMLEYFYRGKIKLELVGSSTSSIKLKATNTTAGGELMFGGEISLVLRYRITQTSDTLFAIPEGGDYAYLMVTLPGTHTIPAGPGTEFTFNLPEPLPAWANDITAQLVYRGQLGNEAGAVAVGSLPIEVNPKAILISLPASGAYASSDGTQPFNRITLKARTELADGLNTPDAQFQLVLVHRFSAGDPYQGTEVATLPENPKTYYVIRANELNNKNSLAVNETAEMTFDLTATPVPLTASDLHVYLVYKNPADPDTSSLAVGYLDISEPTPVDVYNNTDKVCLNGQWYNSGSPEAMAIVDINGNGSADLTDIFPHRISDFYYQPGSSSTASSSNFLLSSTAPLEPGFGRRLGYILSDYYFSQSLTETVTDLDSRDSWELVYNNSTTSADGFVNQQTMGSILGYSGMFSMRGYKMHGGAGVVFDNYEYPEGTNCDWGLLSQ